MDTTALHPTPAGSPSGTSPPARSTAAVGPATLVALGLVVQFVHGSEHVVQFMTWLLDPTSPAWTSPMARAAAGSLASVVLLDPGALLGAELVHLVGNVGFLATLVGLSRLPTTDRLGRLAHADPGRLALARRIQFGHVLEHVALTASVALLGRPIGLSTLAGTLPPGSTAVGFRVTVHFLLNVVPTALVVATLWSGHRQR